MAGVLAGAGRGVLGAFTAAGAAITDAIEEGLRDAADDLGDAAEAVGDAAEDAAEAAQEAGAGFASRLRDAWMRQRRFQMDINHHVFVLPEWLVYFFSGAGVVAFFAKYGKTLCCCYWPLYCCQGWFASCWNRLRWLACPCASEFFHLTIHIDRILVHQTLLHRAGMSRKQRHLQVGVQYGAVWPFGAFSECWTVPLGKMVQPCELPPQRLDGGTVYFQTRPRHLPQATTAFTKVSSASHAGERRDMWQATQCFRMWDSSDNLMPSGWLLKEIRVFTVSNNQGTWLRKYCANGSRVDLEGDTENKGTRLRKYFAKGSRVDREGDTEIDPDNPNAVLHNLKKAVDQRLTQIAQATRELDEQGSPTTAGSSDDKARCDSATGGAAGVGLASGGGSGTVDGASPAKSPRGPPLPTAGSMGSCPSVVTKVSQATTFAKEVRKVEFVGMLEGSTEWPPVYRSRSGGRILSRAASRHESVMQITHRGAEEDLVLVLQVFRQRVAASDASTLFARTAARMAGAVGGLFRDNQDDYELSRSVMVEVRPSNIDAPPWETAFKGSKHLLHVHSQASAVRSLGGVVVSLIRCRVQVAPGHGPVKGKVKVMGFLVPRVAMLQPSLPRHVDIQEEYSRLDVIQGCSVERQVKLTIPMRPTDRSAKLFLRPSESWAQRAAQTMRSLPVAGGVLNRVVTWVTGVGDSAIEDELFVGVMKIRVSPGNDGSTITCEAAGHPPVVATQQDVQAPGTTSRLVNIMARNSKDARGSYQLEFRLEASVTSPEASWWPSNKILFAWILFVMGVVIIVATLVMCVTHQTLFVSNDAGSEGDLRNMTNQTLFVSKDAGWEDDSINMTTHQAFFLSTDAGSEDDSMTMTTNERLFVSEDAGSDNYWRQKTIELFRFVKATCFGRDAVEGIRAKGTRLMMSGAAGCLVVVGLLFVLCAVWLNCHRPAQGSGTCCAGLCFFGMWLTLVCFISLVSLVAGFLLWEAVKGSAWVRSIPKLTLCIFVCMEVPFLIGSICFIWQLWAWYRLRHPVPDIDGRRLRVPKSLEALFSDECSPERGKGSSETGKPEGKAQPKTIFDANGDELPGQLQLLTRRGACWLDPSRGPQGSVYFSESVNTTDLSLSTFITIEDMREALWSLEEKLGLKLHYGRPQVMKLFQKLSGDSRDEQEAISGFVNWHEDRLSFNQFKASWENAASHSDGIDEVTRFKAALKKGSHELSAEEAWCQLLAPDPIQNLIMQWKKHTPASVPGDGKAAVFVKLFWNSSFGTQTRLLVHLRMRHQGRELPPVGHKEETILSPPTCFGYSHSESNIHFTFDNLTPDSTFDEYSITFYLAPVSPSDRFEWSKRLRDCMRKLSVSWSLTLGSQVMDDCRKPVMLRMHLMSQDILDEVDVMDNVYASTAPLLGDDDDDGVPVITEPPTKWWPVSEYRKLLHLLGEHTEQHSEVGMVGVDLLPRLAKFQGTPGSVMGAPKGPPMHSMSKEFHEMMERPIEKAEQTSRGRPARAGEVEVKIAAEALLNRPASGGGAASEFSRIFDKHMGWKARALILPSLTRPSGCKRFVPGGWTLKCMEDTGEMDESGKQPPDWKPQDPWRAQSGMDPIRWLKGVDKEHLVRLRGRRRIVLDAYGEAHELSDSTGRILPGTYEEEEEEDVLAGMSKMEIEHILRQIREKQALPGMENQLFELTVSLTTRKDVELLQFVTSDHKHADHPRSSPMATCAMVKELTQHGEVLPCGCKFKKVTEAPPDCAELSNLATFVEAVSKKSGLELLPATAVVLMSGKRLKSIPKGQGEDGLVLHMLMLAKVHGYAMSKADALRAVRGLLDKQDKSSDAYACFANGDPLQVYLKCCRQRMSYRTSYLDVKMAQRKCCNCDLPSKNFYACRNKTCVCLCEMCAADLCEVKDKLRYLYDLLGGPSDASGESAAATTEKTDDEAKKKAEAKQAEEKRLIMEDFAVLKGIQENDRNRLAEEIHKKFRSHQRSFDDYMDEFMPFNFGVSGVEAPRKSFVSRFTCGGGARAETPKRPESPAEGGGSPPPPREGADAGGGVARGGGARAETPKRPKSPAEGGGSPPPSREGADGDSPPPTRSGAAPRAG